MAEAINWVSVLAALGLVELDVTAADRTLGAVVKYREDLDVVRAAGLDRLVAGA